MPVRKRNGAWTVDVMVEIPGGTRQRLRKRSPIQTKKAALEYEQQLVASVLSTSRNKEERRFSDFAVEFLENHVSVNCKYSTLVTYESALAQHLVPFFGNSLLSKIEERDIARLKASMRNVGRSPKTIRNILTVLSSLFSLAKEWGYLQNVPRVRFPKVPPPRFRFLSLEECLELEAGSTPYWWTMIRLARTSGLRIGELCALEWRQVDLAKGAILVDQAIWRGRVSSPKGNTARLVHLPPKTVEALRQHRGGRSLVFPNTNGEIRKERKCDQGLRRCAKRACLEPFGWHVLRHTYASHLVMKSVPVPVVQELLGHTDIRLTMRYAHLSPSHKVAAVERLDEDAQDSACQHFVNEAKLGSAKFRLVK